MPIAIDPNASIRLILKSDEGKPNPPAFLFKPLTGRQQRKLLEDLQSLDSKKGLDGFDFTFELFRQNLVGAENLPGFDPADPAAILSLREVTELLYKGLYYGPTADDKKN